ncbi:SGNH hydrolase domain-containing protein [Sphingomonas floccifaciens]|uniref:SGNH hydrolase domain-containing protein n=1 Tax=Sphingomonas floccifaciens TaxID=1844115 RepID=A0ABW4N8M6_9SPHN
MVAVTAGAAAIVVAHGVPSRLDCRGAALVAVADDKTRFHQECLSSGDTIIRPDQACRLGKAGVAPTAVLWGDSHAMVAATPMEIAARRDGAAFLFAATADCPVGIGFAIDEGTERGLTTTPSYRYCAQYNADMLALVKRTPSITSVVLAARWTNWRIGEPHNPAETAVDIRLRDETGVAEDRTANAAIAERGLRQLVGELVSAGKTVTIVGPVPEPRFNVPHRLFVQQFGLASEIGPLSVQDYYRRHARTLGIFRRLAASYPVRFIWPIRTLCRGDACPIEDGGRATFFDHNHLSISAAERLAGQFDPVFAKTR